MLIDEAVRNFDEVRVDDGPHEGSNDMRLVFIPSQVGIQNCEYHRGMHYALDARMRQDVKVLWRFVLQKGAQRFEVVTVDAHLGWWW